MWADRALSVLSAIACCWLSTAASAHAITLDRVSAVVNDDIVLESEVRARAAATGRDVASVEVRNQALAELIDAMLVANAARARGLVVLPAEIDRAIEEIRTQNKLDAAAFEVALRAAGLDMPSYRRSVSEQILRIRLLHQLAASFALSTDASPDARARASEAWFAEQHAESYIERIAHPLDRAPINTRDRDIHEIVVSGEPIKLALPSALHPGAKADPALIARAARSVWATGLLADLSFELDDKGVLLIVAKPLPVFHELLINGTPATAASIRRLGALPGSPINPARLHAGLRQWRREQQRLGYYWIEVQETLRPASKDSVDIVVTVREGPLATVDVRITGNQSVDRKVLGEALVYAPRDLLDPAFLEFQSRALQMLYYDRGFVTAEVRGALEPAAATADTRRRVTANFLVKREGAAHTLGAITLVGDAPDTDLAMRTELGLREGAKFSRGGVIDGITRLQRRFEAAGRGYIAIDFETKIEGNKIALTVRTITGLPAPRFGAIAVLGQASGTCRPADLAVTLAPWANEPFSTAALATIRATVERSCKIVAQTRNTAIDASEVELRFLVTHR